jgi:hypothetical protein
VTAAHQVLGTFRYSLNCVPAGSLAPRGSVAFAMRIPIPATASGPVALRWALERGPGATAAVTVGR